MKVAYSQTGAFELSEAACRWIADRKGIRHDCDDVYYDLGTLWSELAPEALLKDYQMHCRRTDPILIECIETLGHRSANGDCLIDIANLDDEADWEIVEFLGDEVVRVLNLRQIRELNQTY